jgi:GntR family transcriptional regulator, transcriptional repressor for pyruvate dehydrogenase complex
LEPIRKIRLSEQIINVIKEMIISDGFKPGDKFYSENELTGKLQVSRSSIREAVRILEVTGIVTVRHGKGIFISESKKEGFEAFAEWVKTHESALIEHFEVRLIIDPKAAAYAARNAESEDIIKLEEACEDFVENYRTNNTPGIIKADEEFHKILAKSTKNRTLYMIMKTMTDSLSEGWISSLHVPGRVKKTIIEHRAVLQAIKDRDPESAERAMNHHINNAIQEIKASIENSIEQTSQE